jgi:hypothetical protein
MAHRGTQLSFGQTQEAALAHYIVKFFKTVTGDNGHVAEIRQFEHEVLAPDPSQARVLGIRKFCDHEQLPSWSLRADRISVEEAEFPS